MPLSTRGRGPLGSSENVFAFSGIVKFSSSAEKRPAGRREYPAKGFHHCISAEAAGRWVSEVQKSPGGQVDDGADNDPEQDAAEDDHQNVADPAGDAVI